MFVHSSIKGFTLNLPKFALSSPLTYKLSRFLNKYLGSIIRISISRYSSTISFYSSSDDFKLYHIDSSSNDFSGLNIGSGFFSHPLWTCIDLPARSIIYKAVQGRVHRDFKPLNLNDQSLKTHFSDNSLDAIYCSHTLEHVTRNSHQTIFSDAHSILKNGGIFRICVPDIVSMFKVVCASKNVFSDELILLFLREAYTPLYAYLIDMTESNRIYELKKIYSELLGQSPDRVFDRIVELYHSAASKEVIFPPDFHISYPTESHLTAVANSAGFKSSYRTSRGISASNIFTNKFLFDTTIPNLSLYMEFVK
jgi:hypothetical protein